jgi:dihydroorotase
MSCLIKNGRVVDPANNIDGVLDVLVIDRLIAKVDKDIQADGVDVLDATGKIVMPGLVDMHVHLREPGREDKETVATGTAAALKGGVTTVLAMPNTTPAMDGPAHVRRLKDIIAKSAKARVLIAGTMTAGRAGVAVCDAAALKNEGVVALTDDGCSVDDVAVMREVLTRAKAAGIPAICHCEDKALAGAGVMNAGLMATILGLRGISAASEYKRVEREISLAKETGARVHIAHVSCRGSVELIRQAKAGNVSVTAETAPHYFTLTEEALADYDVNFKMNPPLRSRDDLDAVREGLKDGAIDAIASDHAPHTENEKEIEFDRSEFGVTGLETQLAVSAELVASKILNWSGLVAKLSLNPARILGLAAGTLGVGADADIAVVDPEAVWTVTKDSFVSKSKNSAFIGRVLKGVVTHTILDGKIVYRRK